MRKLPDHYAILGLSDDATREDVKRAYRRLAKHYHPDRSETGNEERFRHIHQAYETLSDPEKRSVYDRARTTVRRNATPAPRWWEVDREDSLGRSARLGFFAPRGRAAALEIILTPEEATRGGLLRLEVPVELPCLPCQGTGRGFFLFCSDCAGAGRIRVRRPVRFVIPPGVEHGCWLSASLDPGMGEVEARVEIVGRTESPSS